MSYIGPLFLKKSSIGYGCLVLLGSVTVAGIVEVEIKNQTFSKWIQQTLQKVQDGIVSNNSSSSAGEAITASQVFYPFTVVGQEVVRATTTVWPYISSGIQAIPTLFKNWSTLWAQIKSLFSTLIKPEIYKEIFKDLHLKFWKVLSFAIAGGEGRARFFHLFGSEKQKSTLDGLKFLFGSHLEKNKSLKQDQKYFLTSWWDDLPNQQRSLINSKN